MHGRSGSTNRRPNLDVLENRHLLSTVIQGIGVPMPPPPPIMAVVGRVAFTITSPDFGSGPAVPNEIGPAAPPSASWNPTGFGDFQGAWGRSSHHGFAGSSPDTAEPALVGPVLISSSFAAPKGPLGSPFASTSFDPSQGFPDGRMTAMARGRVFGRLSSGDGFSRKGPDAPPLPMLGRDLPRAPFLRGSMMELQLSQNRAIRDAESDLEVVAPVSMPATMDFMAGTNSPALQSVPDFGREDPPGLNLVVDKEEADRAIAFEYTILPCGVLANVAPVGSEASIDELQPANQDVVNDILPKEIPLPHAAGLIASVLPYDQRSLEEAVDQFLDQLHELNVESLIEPNPIRVLVASTVLIGAGLVVETARRRLSPRRRRNQQARVWDAKESEELLGFPELPGSWSTRWI